MNMEQSRSKGGRAAHRKSRSGCENCKRQHKKCDENVPCHRCTQGSVECIKPSRAEQSAKQIRCRGFKVSTIRDLRFATVTDATELQGFEYFARQTVPVLLACQKSALWSRASGYLAQLHPALRSILVALGLQQRVLSNGDQDAVARSVLHCSHTSYVKALRSYRRHLFVNSTGNETVRLFGCLLLVILESLRSSHAEMMIHLTYGARLISAASPEVRGSEEMQDIAMLMQQFCMSSWLYCNSEFFPKTLEALTIRTVVEGYAELESHHLQRSAFDLCNIVRDTVSCLGVIHGRPGFRTQTVESCDPVDCLYHLQQRQQRLAQRLSTCQTPESLESATFHFLVAGSTLSHIYLTAAIQMREIDDGEDSASFKRILGHVEAGLLRLKHDNANASSDRPTAFSTATGAIQLLEATARYCKDRDLRRRAVDLLDYCPEKEGMWSASITKSTLQKLVI